MTDMIKKINYMGASYDCRRIDIKAIMWMWTGMAWTHSWVGVACGMCTWTGPAYLGSLMNSPAFSEYNVCLLLFNKFLKIFEQFKQLCRFCIKHNRPLAYFCEVSWTNAMWVVHRVQKCVRLPACLLMLDPACPIRTFEIASCLFIWGIQTSLFFCAEHRLGNRVFGSSPDYSKPFKW